MADTLLLFSRSKLEGGVLAEAGFDPSDATLSAFWGQCEAILRREVEVRWFECRCCSGPCCTSAVQSCGLQGSVSNARQRLLL